MLPMDAVLTVAPGAVSIVTVAGQESLFEVPQSERHFQRAYEAAVWRQSFETATELTASRRAPIGHPSLLQSAGKQRSARRSSVESPDLRGAGHDRQLLGVEGCLCCGLRIVEPSVRARLVSGAGDAEPGSA
jgi:hypothetical protein